MFNYEQLRYWKIRA